MEFRKTQLARKGIVRCLVAVFVAFITVAGAGRADAQVDWVVNLNDAGSDPVPAGGTIVYNITVSNDGADAAPATTVQFGVAAGTTFTSATGTITGCSPLPSVGPSTVTCNVPPLAALGAQTATLTPRILTTAQGVVAFLPTITDPLDPQPANNSPSETTTIRAGADIALSVAGPATAASGAVINYTYTALNNGPNAATNVVVQVARPAGLTGITPPAGCLVAGTNYNCTIAGPIAVGSSASLAFSGQVAVAGGSSITNNGTSLGGSAPDPQDPIVGNNSASLLTSISGGTDLSITKARSPGGVLLVGDAAKFTLNPRYTGDSPNGIEVVDSIPANYAIDSVVAPGWTCTVTGQNVRCLRTSGSGAGADVALGSIEINTTVVSAGNPTNSTTISAVSPNDANTTNNTATDGGATINVPTVDHSANKSGPNPALVVVGNTYTFNISSTNVGNTGFIGTLRMTDNLPAGLEVSGYTLNGWTCSPAVTVVGPATIVCERIYTAGAPLLAGQTTPNVALQTKATAAGGITNSMTVSAPIANIVDGNGVNDTATYGVTGSIGGDSADISVLKSVTLATVAAGDVQTVRIEVVNAGPQPSSSITLTDNLTNLINNGVGPTGQGVVAVGPLPGGVICNTTSTGGTSRRLACTIASLPVCTPGVDCPVITVDVRYGGDAGTRTNRANAISSATADPDLGNNGGSANFDVTSVADVTVDKTDNPDPVAAGQNLTYIVAARNAPPGLNLSAAADVTITDTLPLGVTFISAAPSSGSCSVTPTANTTTGPGAANRTVTCNLGIVNGGAQQTVQIVVRPNSASRGGTIRNDVVVTTSTIETDTTNNSDFADTAVGSPRLDILVNKGDTIDPLPLGTNTVYVIDVVNDGPSASENVVVTDVMPATILSYQSHSAPGATCAIVPVVGSFGQTLQCTYPVIGPGVTRTITINARGETKGVGKNVVSISSDEIAAGFDFESGNNASDEDTTVRSRADVQVASKVATPGTVNLRDPFTYSIVVRNNAGPTLAEADDVVVSDTLPAGMEITGPVSVSVTTPTVDTPVCGGAAADTSFTCNFGTMSSGAAATITVPVRVLTATAANQTLTNTARVVTSSIDIVPGNNTNSGPVVVNSSSIAGTVWRDFADDGTFNGPDSGIDAVVMTLTGTLADGVTTITRTVNTAPNGTYKFDFLPAGTYTVSQGPVSDPILTNGQTDSGTSGGTVEASKVVISAIPLAAATNATEYDFPKIPGARVIIAKAVQVGPSAPAADGSFTVTFRLAVNNPSIEALINMQVTDALAGAAPNFGTFVSLATPATDPMAAGRYTVLAAPTGSCGGLNAGYNGSAAPIVAAGFGLPAGGTCTIDLQLRVQPTNPLPPLQAGGARYFNQARVTGEGADTGQTPATNPQLTDLSDNGATIDANGNGIGNEVGENDPTPVAPVLNAGTPLISLDIQIATINDTNGNGIPDAGDVIVYTFTVTNTGPVDLIDVIIDPASLSLPLGLVCTPVSLAIGETKTLVCTGNTYVITPADQAFGTVSLSGTTRGQSIIGQAVSDDDAVVSALLGPSPLSITKTVSQSQVKIGDVVTFTITVVNSSATLSRVSNVVDQLPAGLIYQAGSGTVNTVATEPTVSGRTLTWPAVSIPSASTTVITLDVLIGGSVTPGDHDNHARVIDPASGLAETPDAIATIRLIAEPVFSCSTVIGRVFDDPNQDGYFNGEPKEDRAAITDQVYHGNKYKTEDPDAGPEKGMPNVRLIAPNGDAVTTDQFGRFSIPCASLPADIGSNFMLKLDTRTLPEGYRLSTENPRVVRVTPGMLTKMNFGVSRSKVMKIDLNSNAFVDGKPRAELVSGLTQMVAQIATKPSMVRLTYVLGQGEDKSQARRYLRSVEKLLRKLWPANGKYQLNVETVIQRNAAGAVNE